MQVTFLGTAGSEGTPSLHCKCRVCENARKVKGKEIRTRSGVLIDDALMIDFSPDTFCNVLRYGINFTNIKHLLITHSHSDHFCPDDIVPYIVNENQEKFEPFNVYANDVVLKELLKRNSGRNLVLHEMQYEKTVEIAEYKVTPFRAMHVLGEKCMLYLIEKGDKSYLHLNDTGIMSEEIFTWLKDRNVKISLASIDTTFGLLTTEYPGHMNLNQCVKTCNKFRDMGIFTSNTKVYATHLCHWGGTHEEIAEKAKEHLINVAYDGLKIQL